MPRRRAGDDHAPRDFAVPGSGDWPNCEVAGPPWALSAHDFSLQLAGALHGRAIKPFARQAGVDINVVTRLLRGETWGDTLTTLKIAAAANLSLLTGPALQRKIIDRACASLAAYTGNAEYRQEIETGANWAVIGAPATFTPDYFDPGSQYLLDGVALTTGDPLAEVDAVRERIRLWEAVSGFKIKSGLLLAAAPTENLREHLHKNQIPAVWPDGDWADNVNGALIGALTRHQPPGRTAHEASVGTTLRD